MNFCSYVDHKYIHKCMKNVLCNIFYLEAHMLNRNLSKMEKCSGTFGFCYKRGLFSVLLTNVIICIY